MRNDQQRLRDILEAIERIERYVVRGEKAFRESELIQNWIVHHLQIIGEAGRSVSPQFRQPHTHVPWSKIIGMRNILAHDYFGIDLDIVWDAATKDLPPLKQQILGILHPSEEENA